MLNKFCYSYNRSRSARSDFSLFSIPKTRISQLSIFQTYLILRTGSKSLVTHVSYTTKITSHQWIFFKENKTGTKEAERKTAGEDSRLGTHPTEPEHTSFSPTYNTIWRSCHPWYICVSRASYIIAFLASQFSNASMLLCSRVTHAQRHAGFTPPKPRRKRRANDDDDDDSDGSQGDIHDSLRRKRDKSNQAPFQRITSTTTKWTSKSSPRKLRHKTKESKSRRTGRNPWNFDPRNTQGRPSGRAISPPSRILASSW